MRKLICSVGALALAVTVFSNAAAQPPAPPQPAGALTVDQTPLSTLLSDPRVKDAVKSIVPALQGTDTAKIGALTLQDAHAIAPTQITGRQVTAVRTALAAATGIPSAAQ